MRSPALNAYNSISGPSSSQYSIPPLVCLPRPPPFSHNNAHAEAEPSLVPLPLGSICSAGAVPVWRKLLASQLEFDPIGGGTWLGRAPIVAGGQRSQPETSRRWIEVCPRKPAASGGRPTHSRLRCSIMSDLNQSAQVVGITRA